VPLKFNLRHYTLDSTSAAGIADTIKAAPAAALVEVGLYKLNAVDP
jgi:hypothetical protein